MYPKRSSGLVFFISKFTGTGENNVIQRITELTRTEKVSRLDACYWPRLLKARNSLLIAGNSLKILDYNVEMK